VRVEEYKEIKDVPITRVIGIDVGVKELLTTSDGTIIKNMKFIEKYENKLKGLNKWLSRCQKGSKNREKVRKWECPHCTNMNNRDVNASINIMWEGIKTYMKSLGDTKLQIK